MSAEDDLVVRLRRRILTRLHIGEIEPGDRLPSIRAVAGELDRDHRAVSAAYRVLEQEGLVDVRPRSGVYLADRDRLEEGELPSPTARWVVNVLVEGLSRRIPIPEIPEIMEQCTRRLDLRCGLVESVEDVLEALRHEVERDVGLSIDSLVVSNEQTPRDEDRLGALLDEVDVVLSTVFHAPAVRPLAEEREVPLVEVKINADWVATFRRELGRGAVTVLVADPTFEPRLRAAVGADREGDLRVIEVESIGESLEAKLQETAVFVTPSARKRIADTPHQSVLQEVGVLENVPMLAHRTFRELAEILVWQNLELGRCP